MRYSPRGQSSIIIDRYSFVLGDIYFRTIVVVRNSIKLIMLLHESQSTINNRQGRLHYIYNYYCLFEIIAPISSHHSISNDYLPTIPRLYKKLKASLHLLIDHFSASLFLMCAMAFPGFKCFGQTLLQFIIVWQRYNLKASSNSANLLSVKSSRESSIHR